LNPLKQLLTNRWVLGGTAVALAVAVALVMAFSGDAPRKLSVDQFTRKVTEGEVRAAFAKYKPLPVGERGPDEVPYEGRHLITGEVVERMKVNLA